MEGSVFPLPAVAGELHENYVEARLHTDGEDRLPPEVDARNKELQRTMTKSSANPYFVIYDPKTGQVLRKKGGMLFEREFLKLLRGGGSD